MIMSTRLQDLYKRGTLNRKPKRTTTNSARTGELLVPSAQLFTVLKIVNRLAERFSFFRRPDSTGGLVIRLRENPDCIDQVIEPVFEIEFAEPYFFASKLFERGCSNVNLKPGLLRGADRISLKLPKTQD